MTGLHRHGNQINKHIRADLLAHIVAVCVYVYVCMYVSEAVWTIQALIMVSDFAGWSTSATKIQNRRRHRAIDLAFAFDRLEPSKQRPLARQPIYFCYEKWLDPSGMFAISSRNARMNRPWSEVPVHVWGLICFYASVERDAGSKAVGTSPIRKVFENVQADARDGRYFREKVRYLHADIYLLFRTLYYYQKNFNSQQSTFKGVFDYVASIFFVVEKPHEINSSFCCLLVNTS